MIRRCGANVSDALRRLYENGWPKLLRTRYGGKARQNKNAKRSRPRSVVSQSRLEEDPRLKTMWDGYALRLISGRTRTPLCSTTKPAESQRSSNNPKLYPIATPRPIWLIKIGRRRYNEKLWCGWTKCLCRCPQRSHPGFVYWLPRFQTLKLRVSNLLLSMESRL